MPVNKIPDCDTIEPNSQPRWIFESGLLESTANEIIRKRKNESYDSELLRKNV